MHFTSGNPFVSNGPEVPADIVTLPFVVACVLPPLPMVWEASAAWYH